MRKIGYLKAIVQSFYSRNLYRDVAKNWRAGVMLYLLLVLTICLLPITVAIQKKINQQLPQAMADYIPQIPVIHIKDGIASTPENRPYYIKNVKTNEVFAIIDTSGKFKTLDNLSANFLLTSTEMISRSNDNMVKIEKLSPKLDMDIQPTQIKNLLEDWVSWIWVIVFPAALLITFLFRLVQGLFYAAIGKIFSLIMKIELTYGVILKLALVALTPAIIVRTVVGVMGYHFYREGLFFFALAMVYLIFAMKANKRN